MDIKNSSNRIGKICLYCFFIIAAILGIVAFILILTRKCGEGFDKTSTTQDPKITIKKKVKDYQKGYLDLHNKLDSELNAYFDEVINPPPSSVEINQQFMDTVIDRQLAIEVEKAFQSLIETEDSESPAGSPMEEIVRQYEKEYQQEFIDEVQKLIAETPAPYYPTLEKKM